MVKRLIFPGVIACLCGLSSAFLVPLPSQHVVRQHARVAFGPEAVQARPFPAVDRRGGVRMMAARATLVVSLVSRRADEPGVFEIKTTYYSSATDGLDRTWTVNRRYNDLEDFQRKVTSRRGFVLPVLPPEAILSSDLFPLEDFFNKALQVERIQTDPALRELLDVPREIKDLEEDGTPAVTPEVLDQFGRLVEGPDGKGNVASGAAVAGGVLGFLFGGPMGAVVGAGLGGMAAQRDDSAGDVARTAGKAANIAIRKAKQIDNRFEVTRRAGDLLKGGYEKVKQAVEKLDDK